MGFDLCNCTLLTNTSLQSITRLKLLKILSLENCSLVDDNGIKLLVELTETLESLSFSGLHRITDAGLFPIATQCRKLKLLNVNNCPEVTHHILQVFAKNNGWLETLCAAGTYITDEGLSLISVVLSKKNMTSLDISFCRDVTDFGLITLSEICCNLKFLNLCSLSRVTDVGIQHIISNCWYLEELNMEDIFLLDDKSFWFSSSFDGRPAANENMLKSLKKVNLRECVNITNRAMLGLAERCRSIERLSMSGCEKLDDICLEQMIESYGSDLHVGLCDSLKYLDLSYCPHISSSGVMKMLPFCGCLEELNVSGMITVNDLFIQQLCTSCRTIQRLIMQRCVLITDAALCSMADHLWIEKLDISGCGRISDDGIEVLTASCNGMLELSLRRLSRLTSRSIYAMIRNCLCLEKIDIQDCSGISSSLCLTELEEKNPAIKIINSSSSSTFITTSATSSTSLALKK